ARRALWRLASAFASPGPRCSSVSAGRPLMRAYPSAAPLHTPSKRPSTARTEGTRSSALTSAISVVPGLAKHTSMPAAAAVCNTASAPVIAPSSFGSLGLKRRAQVSDQRQQARANVPLEQVRAELERGAAASDDHRLGSVARVEGRRHRIDVTAPVSESEAKAVLLVVAEGRFEALPRQRPLRRTPEAD